MAAAAGVRVRGSCKKGHITETVADKGRVTAQVECSDPGCDERVNCRRIPKDQVPPKPPADDAGTTRVVRVADYDDTSSGAQGDPGGLAVADTDPAELEPGAGSDSEPAGGPPDPLTEHGERTGPIARWKQRRRSAGARRPTGWQHPLGI